MRSAYVAEQQLCCLRYVQNICFRLFLLPWSLNVLPVHLLSLSSFQLRSISSVLETMPLRRRILLLSQRDRRSSTLMYGPGYLSCGTGQQCSAIIYHTRLWILPVCRQRSFPVSRTGGYGIHHVPRYRVLLFPYGNMESKKSVCMVIFLHRWSCRWIYRSWNVRKFRSGKDPLPRSCTS